MKTTILMVEGRHDASFICRILKAHGFKDSKLKIGEFPVYLKEFITCFFSEAILTEHTARDLRSSLVLPSVLSHPDNKDELFIVFAMGGIAQIDTRRRIIDPLSLRFSLPISRPVGHELRIIYNFDADDDGIQKREDSINAELKSLLGDDFPTLDNQSWVDYDNISWGMYVFTEPDTDKGKLEHLVIPLMERNRQSLKERVTQFISHRPEYPEMEHSGNQYDEEKTRISLMGSMEYSGSANTLLIEKSQLIDDKSLREGVYEKLFRYITE